MKKDALFEHLHLVLAATGRRCSDTLEMYESLPLAAALGRASEEIVRGHQAGVLFRVFCKLWTTPDFEFPPLPAPTGNKVQDLLALEAWAAEHLPLPSEDITHTAPPGLYDVLVGMLAAPTPLEQR